MNEQARRRVATIRAQITIAELIANSTKRSTEDRAAAAAHLVALKAALMADVLAEYRQSRYEEGI